MGTREELLGRIEAERDEIIKLCSDLVAAPSPNPPGDTRKVAAVVKSFLEKRGLKYEVVAPQDTMPNILATTLGVEPGKHLVYNGHMDVFPVSEADKWELDPFSGAVVDGKMYGRGVSDMKAGDTASLISYAYMAGMADRMKGKITLALVSDEETFGPWGARYLFEHHRDRVMGDALLNGEPSSMEAVRIGEKGMLWIEVETTGSMVHGAYVHAGKNAVRAMQKVLADLTELESIPTTLPTGLAETIRRNKETIDAELGAGGADLMGRVSVNEGVIEGGLKVNLVADRCRAEVDIRIPPGLTVSTIMGKLEEIMSRHRDAKYRVIQGSEPSLSPEEGEASRLAQKNVLEVTGFAPVPSIGIGATDARLWRLAGVPGIVFGPPPCGMGQANEFVKIEDLINTVKVHVLTSYDFLDWK